MEVYLVRHGESEYNVGATENLDSRLTPLGEKQADRAAGRLAGERLTQIYVSPFRRTLQTAGPICAAADLPAELLPEICEFFSATNHGYRTFTGLDAPTIQRDYPWASSGSAFPFECPWQPQPLETAEALIVRAERARDALLRLHGGSDSRVLLISHADTVARLTEAFLRVPRYANSPAWVENCSVTRLHCGPDTRQPAHLLYVNDISHLAGLAP